MRIFANKLAEHLQRQLQHRYLIFGNEPLFIQESCIAIQQAAKANGFEERHSFTIDNHLNWNDVLDCCQALSLFSSKQIIELRLPETGVNAAIGKALLELSQWLHNDIVLMLVGEKLTKAQEKSAWYQALMGSASTTYLGIMVICQTPDITRLPQFVQTRCNQLKLKPDPEALQMLATWHEGNLFALSQSLEKLSLLYPDGALTLIRLEESLNRHNHYTVYHWIEAILIGKAKRAQRILRQLKAESVEATILLRSLQKELVLIHHLQKSTLPFGQTCDKYAIWQNRRHLYSMMLQRISHKKSVKLINLLTKAEMIAKMQYDTSPWPLLMQLTLEMTTPQVDIAIPA